MQAHQLQPKYKSKSKKIVGRGGKKGTYSGKGGKGQTARSGRKLAPIIRELIKRYPKLKGYRGLKLKDNFAVVKLDAIEKYFTNGETVNPKTLVDKGVIRQLKGKNPLVKILGDGKLTKKISIEKCAVSKSAKTAIEKAGGAVK